MTQDWSQSNSRSFPRQENHSRWPFIVAAGALGGFALLRRTKTSAALAAAGAWALQRSARNPVPQSFEAKATFAVNCAAEQAYSLWRNFEGLSRILHHIESVKVLDDRRSEWVALGPFGKRVRWIAEIVEDQPNERLSWRSVPGSDIDTEGEIEFRPRIAGRGINITARVAYAPAAGAAAKSIAWLTGRHPEFTVREDLRRFKAMLEAGEIPTTVGQPHGPRGLHGHVYRTLLRENQNASPPQAEMPEALQESERRIA